MHIQGKTSRDLVVYKKARSAHTKYPYVVVVKLLIPKGTKVNVPYHDNWDSSDVRIEDAERVTPAYVNLVKRKFTWGLSSCDLKCRAARAVVLEIQSLHGGKLSEKTTAFSDYDMSFVYKVGKKIRPAYEFEEYTSDPCASGIHFFFGRRIAEDYSL